MDNRLMHLLDAYLENRLSDTEAGELRDTLRASTEARRMFWEYIEQHALIEDLLGEARGRDLAVLETAAECAATLPEPSVTVRRRPGTRFATRTVLAAALLIALGVGLSLLLRPFGRTPERSSEVIATLRSLAGNVQLTDAAGAALPLTPDTDLFTGNLLQVGEDDSRVELVFTDGTRVSFGSGTSIRLLSGAAGGKSFHLERGAVQVQTPSPQEDRLLVVTTDQARITANETRFRLYREGNSSRLELAEGTARLESRGQETELAAGSFVVVTDEQPMVPQVFPSGRCRLQHTFLKGGDAVGFSRDGRQVVTSHFSRGWSARDVVTGALQSKAPGSGQRTLALAFTSLPDTALVLGNNGTAGLWKTSEGRANQTRLRDQELRGGAISADGNWLAQGSKNEVVVWELDSVSGSLSLRRTLPLKASRVALSSVEPLVAVSRWGGEIQLFEVKSDREVAQYKLSRTPTPLSLSDDARFVAAYAISDGLVLFERASGQRQTLWSGQGARVSTLRFSANGHVLMAGLDDGTVRAWSVTDGRLLLVLETGHRHVSALAMTVDLSLLATVGDNDSVKIWECQLP